MGEPWFDANQYAWIPGTVYGTAAGVLGGLSGALAQRGKARGLILGLCTLFIVVAVLFLAVAAYAYFTGQPYGIWYGLGLPGLIGILVIPAVLPQIRRQYQAAEDRAMRAKDLG